MTYVRTEADRLATQNTAVFGILEQHCGQVLTPDLVDKINDELKAEMRTGSTSWAFKPTEET